MKSTEHELAARIARLLDAGAAEMDRGTAEKLAAVRKQALARYESQPAPAWRWAAVTSGGRGRSDSGSWWSGGLRTVLVAAVVVSAIAIGVTWHSTPASDIADIDAALLTDELPINAFLDQGFDSWLKRASR